MEMPFIVTEAYFQTTVVQLKGRMRAVDSLTHETFSQSETIVEHERMICI
jgi:hypothetical protein